MSKRTLIWGLFFGLCFTGLLCDTGFSQTEEMAVADKVSDLEGQLTAASFEDRDKAEEEIIKLGSQALDFISDPSEDSEEDLNLRLVRIRKKLEKVAIEETITPSKITLSGEISLKKAFAEIKSQTGNIIELAEGYDPALLDKKVKLDLKDASFWKAFSKIQTVGGLESNAYGGVTGRAVVVPLPPVDPANIDKVAAGSAPPLDESSIFRIRVASVSSAKNLLRAGLNYTRVNLEIEWEPRLTPISIDMPLSEIKVLDVDGKPLKISNPQQVLSGTVQQGINQIEMAITLENVDRSIKAIGSITGKLDCILPGRKEKFRFPPLGRIEDNPKISKAGITVQYMGFEKNEDLYAVELMVSMETKSEKFDSHMGWIYDNPLFLIDEIGEKEPSIGQQGGDVNATGVGIEYFFIEDPTNVGLLYESPGAIVPFPAQFSLKDIPLP